MRLSRFNIKMKSVLTFFLIVLVGVMCVVTYKSFGIMRSKQRLETPEQRIMVQTTSDSESVSEERNEKESKSNK